MAWPIPTIPEKLPLVPPRYGVWAVILILVLLINILSALFFGNITVYGELLIYGVLPGLLLWMCFFGVVLNRYEQSSASVLAWSEETLHTKTQWQQWSRVKISVVGNVLLTPEAKGIGVLLGKAEDIPMYPKKARPLFGEPHILSRRLSDLDSALEHQCPGYRHHLHIIFVWHASALHRENIITSIFNQWDLIAEPIDNIEKIAALYDVTNLTGVILVLCLQHWPDSIPQSSSEFISAQLITSRTFSRSQALPVLAELGRMMPLAPGQLSNDLDMLFNYSGISKNQLQHVWLSSDVKNTPVEIALYADVHQWALPASQPVHLIDLSFGPPGEISFAISLAMIVEAVSNTEQDHLVISQTPQQSGWLCLVSRELIS